MMASLFAGVSGLKNHQVKMNVIGNNIANVNTIGFKAGRVNFQEALVQNHKGAGPTQFTDGRYQPAAARTGHAGRHDRQPVPAGRSGNDRSDHRYGHPGCGILHSRRRQQQHVSTRAPAHSDSTPSSTLVDPATGLFVQGKMADATGTIPSLATTGNIILPFGQQDPAKPTEVISLANNIDVSATDSIASLFSAGASGVAEVSGYALDGVGGQHVIEITGTQAVNATFTGTTLGNEGDGIQHADRCSGIDHDPRQPGCDDF